MANVTLTHAELAELLGVPASTSHTKLLRLMNKRLLELEEARDPKKLVAAEAQIVEDHRIVNAAVADGRVPEHRRDHWIEAMARDRDEARQLLATFTAIPAEIAQMSREATRRHAGRHIAAAAPDAGAAVASAVGHEPRWEPVGGTSSNEAGAYRAQVGKPREQWTERERHDEMLRQFNHPWFGVGTKPAPGRELTYVDSPNAPYKIDPVTGRFVERTHQERQAGRIRGQHG